MLDSYNKKIIAEQIIFQSNEMIRLHIDSLAHKTNYVFNKDKYEKFGQLYIESSEEFEQEKAQDINWDIVTKKTDRILDLICKKSSQEEKFNPFIAFSLNILTNYSIYEQMYPKSYNNIWKDLVGKLISNTCLLNIEESQEKDTSLIFKDNPNKTKKKKLNAFIYSNLFKYYSFLKENAYGRKNVISLKVLSDEFSTSKENIQINSLVPLKRMGVIGSNHKGYFFIKDKEDLKLAYNYHLKHVAKTLETVISYRKVAKQKYNINLPFPY